MFDSADFLISKKFVRKARNLESQKLKNLVKTFKNGLALRLNLFGCSGIHEKKTYRLILIQIFKFQMANILKISSL